MLTLELRSETLPPGKSIIINLSDTAHLDEIKKNPEGLIEQGLRESYQGAAVDLEV